VRVRSYTSSELPGRCKRCWIRQEFCICADVGLVTPRTHLVIVRHLRESWKSTGTARAATLAVPSLTCLEYGEDTEPAQSALAGGLAQKGTYLLFPSDEAPSFDAQDVQRLVVLDGTWRQTRRMYHRLPVLHGLPRLSLPAKTREVLQLRASSFAEGRSTLEAIADALALIEGPELGEQLHRVHALFVERVLRARGAWDEAE
jgi:DTW domain-containing protein YfiP